MEPQNHFNYRAPPGAEDKVTDDQLAEFWKKVGMTQEDVKDTKVLNLNDKQLTNEDCLVIGHIAANGSLAELEELWLGGNQIGDGVLQAFASAVLPNLTHLGLAENNISDGGMQAFATVVASGSLPKLRTLYVDDGALGTKHPALQAACQARGIRLP
jgi:Ran GTPase-activating protein (RanGAP) involved in mRNA processing and transport